MNYLTTWFELARNGKQFTLALFTESPPRVKARARGSILGTGSPSELSIKQVESFPRQEEAVLTALLELSAGDSAFQVNRLCEQVFNGDRRSLEGVLQRMQERGVVTLEKGADGELAAKLTLKGAVVALYGDWLLGDRYDDSKPSSAQVPLVRSSN